MADRIIRERDMAELSPEAPFAHDLSDLPAGRSAAGRDVKGSNGLIALASCHSGVDPNGHGSLMAG
jgi:hypothetical protein